MTNTIDAADDNRATTVQHRRNAGSEGSPARAAGAGTRTASAQDEDSPDGQACISTRLAQDVAGGGDERTLA
jgi:hypothetical protein